MSLADEGKAQETLAPLKQKAEELDELIEKRIYNNPTHYTYYFTQWHSETLYLLVNIFGKTSIEATRFAKLTKLPSGTATQTQWARYKRSAMLKTAAELQAILSAPETTRKSQKRKPLIAANAFIAHGGKTDALNKTQTYLKSLGVNPLVAEDEASEGNSVDCHITRCLDDADCALILGTADDKNLKDGKLYPRPNVSIEIGRIQERFPHRVIYLLEEGAAFPTNVAEKVYERFTQENMEKAFIKIARELKAFGILHATSTRK